MLNSEYLHQIITESIEKVLIDESERIGGRRLRCRIGDETDPKRIEHLMRAKAKSKNNRNVNNPHTEERKVNNDYGDFEDLEDAMKYEREKERQRKSEIVPSQPRSSFTSITNNRMRRINSPITKKVEH